MCGLVLVCRLQVTALQFEKYRGLEKAFRKDDKNLILLQYPSVVLDSYNVSCTKASSGLSPGFKVSQRLLSVFLASVLHVDSSR